MSKNWIISNLYTMNQRAIFLVLLLPPPVTVCLLFQWNITFPLFHMVLCPSCVIHQHEGIALTFHDKTNPCCNYNIFIKKEDALQIRHHASYIYFMNKTGHTRMSFWTTLYTLYSPIASLQTFWVTFPFVSIETLRIYFH